jgi:hypothetical protein
MEHSNKTLTNKGGVMVSPEDLSAKELEKLTRKLVLVRLFPQAYCLFVGACEQAGSAVPARFCS